MGSVRLSIVVVSLASYLAMGVAIAAGGPTVSYHFGQNGGVTRLLMSLPRGVTYEALRVGDVETIGFGRSVRFSGASAGVSLNVRSVKESQKSLAIGLLPGRSVTVSYAGDQLVLLIRPGLAALQPAIMSGREASSLRDGDRAETAGAGSVLPGLPSPLVAVVDTPIAGVARPEVGSPHQQSAVFDAGTKRSRTSLGLDPGGGAGVDAPGPVSVAATIKLTADGSGRGLLLPFGEGVGAAAYRQGGRLVVVLDSVKPVDLSAVAADPLYHGARYSLLQSGAVLTVPLATGASATLQRQQGGWLIAVGGTKAEVSRIEPHVDDDALQLPVAEPGHVVVIPSVTSGSDMLVGTTRRDGQALPVAHHAVDYILNATLLGVTIERFSETLELRPSSSGFVLSVPVGHGLRSLAHLRPEHDYSRVLDLANVSVGELQRRYKDAVAAAAAAPLAARRLARLDAAEAALGLDRGREAADIAAIADQDAPGEPDEERSHFLVAASSVLIDAPDATALLADPRLRNTDEVALWRALDEAHRHPDDGEAAHVIAEHIPLLLSYPERLRRHLVGRAALSLAVAGSAVEAGLIGKLEGDGTVTFAKAVLDERRDRNAAALIGLDQAALDDDPAVAARAAEAAVSLRLKLHMLTPAQAADRLEAHVLDARMAGDELSLRLRIADLRAEQHDWRAALASLRDVDHDFPDAADEVRRRAGVLLKTLAATPPTPVSSVPLAAGGTIDSVAQLALLEDNLDLAPPGKERADVTLALASRLEALDLVDQAAALIKTQLDRSEAGAERGELGLELARLQLVDGNHAGAVLALDTTDAGNLPDALVAARALLRARAADAAGDPAAALKALRPLHGVEAEELRARELDATHDWAGEEAALTELVTLRLPPHGLLDRSGEDLILRLGGAAARAGDQVALRHLEPVWKQRFSDPEKLAMLRLLASPSAVTLSDLPALKSDLAAARAALPTRGSAIAKSGS